MQTYAWRRAIPGLSRSMLCARAIPGLRGQSMVCTTNHGFRVCAGQSRDCANPRFARNIYMYLYMWCRGGSRIFGKKGGPINTFTTGGVYVGGVPLPYSKGVWGSADSSPSGVWGVHSRTCTLNMLKYRCTC